jgi:hypothetical protein
VTAVLTGEQATDEAILALLDTLTPPACEWGEDGTEPPCRAPAKTLRVALPCGCGVYYCAAHTAFVRGELRWLLRRGHHLHCLQCEQRTSHRTEVTSFRWEAV